MPADVIGDCLVFPSSVAAGGSPDLAGELGSNSQASDGVTSIW